MLASDRVGLNHDTLTFRNVYVRRFGALCTAAKPLSILRLATERDGGLEAGRSAARESEGAASQERDKAPGMERDGVAKGVDRGLGL